MIDILLATYNSSRYIDETLASILSQDEATWQLIIQDGGSTDDTLKRMEEYARSYPGQIVYLPSERSLSARDNFSKLLDQSRSDYVMFCDHDDIWFPDKIFKTLKTMKQAEQDYGPDMPLLVFTDKKVVDDDLNLLRDSDLQYQNLDPARIALNHLIFQNVPSGCTMMLNRILANLCRPIPPQAVMHDHWVSLVAAALGEIVFLNEPTMLYHQHDHNYYGAANYGWHYFYTWFRNGSDSIRSRLKQYIDQARAFYDRYSDRLQPKHRQMLAELSRWPELSWWDRRKVLLKHRIFKTGLRRNLGLFCIA